MPEQREGGWGKREREREGEGGREREREREREGEGEKERERERKPCRVSDLNCSHRLHPHPHCFTEPLFGQLLS